MARLFPTTVIGSLPRPVRVQKIIDDRRCGRISEEEAGRLLDGAVETSLALQERAGLDEITDGEWRRLSYVAVFAERVRGFEEGSQTPVVVAPMEYHRPIVAEEIRFVRRRTRRRVKATLPGPYLVGRRLWDHERSRAAYPSRERFMEACVPLLRREIELIREAGADTIQLDEPWLSRLVQRRYQEREGIGDVQSELDRCAGLINQTLEGIEGMDTGVHLCHAHMGRVQVGHPELFMPTLGRLRAGIISMEYATQVAGPLQALTRFPEGPRLGFGCIDRYERRAERPEEVAARVEEAMRYVGKERIVLHPDCGFVPSDPDNPMTLDEACRKLKAMCRAAEMLRERHG